MQRRKPKDKPLKVTLEYEPTPDGEERLNRIFELLLSKQAESQKNNIKRFKKIEGDKNG